MKPLNLHGKYWTEMSETEIRICFEKSGVLSKKFHDWNHVTHRNIFYPLSDDIYFYEGKLYAGDYRLHDDYDHKANGEKIPTYADTTKIRRRIEDALRKMDDPNTVLRIADILRVKTTEIR